MIMENKKNARKTALVTGASFGIGLEIARQLAAEGHDLILAARSAEKLAEVSAELSKQGVEVRVIASDLSVSGSALQLYQEIQRQKLRVDILVNNAGAGLHGLFQEMELSSVSGMMRLNMEALTELTRLFLPDMTQAGFGRVLNVASTAAFQPGPLMAAYYASKAYVLMFSEALSEEVRGSGVTVTVLCPGPTHSEFQKRAGMSHVELFTRFSMDARKVARDGIRGMHKGKTLVISGLLNNLLAFSIRFTPRFLIPKIVYSLQSGRLEK